MPQDLIKQEHYHKIQERDKIECVEKIIELLNIIEIHNDEMKEYCQLGLTQGLRVICYKINNTLYPLFLDPHHLIYPNKKYNYKDFDKNKCCIFGNGD